MAASMNKLRLVASRSTYRIRPRRDYPQSIAPFRPFTSSPLCRRRRDEGEDKDESSSSKRSKKRTPTEPVSFYDTLMHPEDRKLYDSLTPEERIEYEQEYARFHREMSAPQVQRELQGEVSQAVYEYSREAPAPDISLPPKIKLGFMAMGEDDEVDSGEDDIFDGDDISSIAHGELEQHREIRQYARIAAWEMPLLAKFAKPFTPPSKDHPLRFRYTSYMGESHPAAKKVVLEFCPSDLSTSTSPMTPPQLLKLIKLLGVRYDPQKDLCRISCEMFETQAQNKRYLGDLVETLVKEAREGEDGFEDIPVDFRHVKWKRKLEFPEEWRLTEGRRTELYRAREERLLAEQRRVALEGPSAAALDGVKIIDEALRVMQVEVPRKAPLTERATAVKGRGDKGKLRRGREK
ncbi:MAG: 37S ribosomal protein S24, mitochondrial [Icmadophila ericetorum]|nr:37S ribosomal protein S24, mitochondrial [Icmadophila ericetorum]